MSEHYGIQWIDIAFNCCLELFVNTTYRSGTSFEEIDIWLFFIIWPILTLIILVEIIRLKLKIIFKN